MALRFPLAVPVGQHIRVESFCLEIRQDSRLDLVSFFLHFYTSAILCYIYSSFTFCQFSFYDLYSDKIFPNRTSYLEYLGLTPTTAYVANSPPHLARLLCRDMSLADLTLPVANLPTSTSFYLSCLKYLGYQFTGRDGENIGLGQKSGEPADFWITARKPGYVSAYFFS